MIGWDCNTTFDDSELKAFESKLNHKRQKLLEKKKQKNKQLSVQILKPLFILPSAHSQVVTGLVWLVNYLIMMYYSAFLLR